MSDDTRQRLSAKLHEVRQRLQRIQDNEGVPSEADTKANLIEPILEGLGWDVKDLGEMKREYRHKSQDNPVDFSLFIGTRPILFVEAKALREKMNDRKWITQTVNYANTVGVKWCVLTNGDEYRLYNSGAECDVEEKVLGTAKVSDLVHDSATLDILDLLSKESMGQKTQRTLDVLWEAQFIDRHVRAALEDLLKRSDVAVIRLIRKSTPHLDNSQVRESLKRASIQIDYPPVVFPLASTTLAALADQVAAGGQDEDETPVPPKRGRVRRPETARVKPQGSRTKSPAYYGVSLRQIIEAGGLKTPVELERRFKGQQLTATILDDGRVRFDGDIYDSLSISAAMARKSIIGAPPGRDYPQTNGWEFWQFRDPKTTKLERIDVVRQQFLKLASPKQTG